MSMRITIAVSVALLLTIMASEAVADTLRVGPSRDYTTIQDAVDDAQDDDVILVDAGTTADPNWYIGQVVLPGLDLTIQSTDTANPERTVIAIPWASRYTKKCIRATGTHNAAVVINGFTITLGSCGVYGIEGSDCVIRNCVIEDNQGYGGIYFFDGTIEDCIIQDNESDGNGGGVYGSGTTKIKGCTISGNEAAHSGGGVFLCSEIKASAANSCVIDHNTAGHDGGGVYGGIYGTSMTIIGVEISYNHAGIDGGGVAGPNIKLSGVEIFENDADGDGGGVHGVTSIDGFYACEICDNRADGNGGGLADCTADIDVCEIDDNTAGGNGGGVYECRIVSECYIRGNQAKNGGGIYGSASGGKIEDNFILDNTAGSVGVGENDGNGGGIASATVSITGNDIEDNFAYGDGGGVYSCSVYISRNKVRGNLAYGDGGGFACCDDDTIINCLIYDNQATNGGGLYDCDTEILHNTIVYNIAGSINTAGRGGGIRNCGGSNCKIKNNIIWGNIAFGQGQHVSGSKDPRYCCIGPNYSGGGTKIRTGDPKLVNTSGSYSEYWNLKLGVGSSCLDKGKDSALSTDYDGEANSRPVDLPGLGDGDGNDADIGAYEMQSAPQ